MKNVSTILATLVLVFAFMNTASAEDWNVSATAKKKLNPYELSKKNISSGKKVYQTNCKSCHGDPTKANMLPLVPVPSDLGSQNFLVQSDGEIYHKIKTGKGAMPTFDKTLNDESKWMVIAYLRSFDKNKKKIVAIKAVVNPNVSDVKIEANTKVEYKDYNWNLNEIE